MAKVLIVESDSVFAAVLADRLHVAGHEVLRLADGSRAAATAQAVDLVVLGESPGAGLGVVEALSGQRAREGCAALSAWKPRAVVQRLEASGPCGSAGVLVADGEAGASRRRPDRPLAQQRARAAEPAGTAPPAPVTFVGLSPRLATGVRGFFA